MIQKSLEETNAMPGKFWKGEKQIKLESKVNSGILPRTEEKTWIKKHERQRKNLLLQNITFTKNGL
jgi:hypothetical protein